jgi:hypothetical protein
MIRYENQDLIGGVGGRRGGMPVAVAARGLARPGCGGRWLTAGPMVGFGVGPAVPWPAVGGGRA